ncbi:hypothetical protein PROP_02900 [Propionicimonas sp. T2.31MG-18]|uniref:sialidase family protein n=1 Tax=Propionicimonas sp. T2.31MG-18 TaxID=3157620 RepID=UPI0035EF206D
MTPGGPRVAGHRRADVYVPAERPGFAAWVTGFDYGDGRIGVSFKETTREANSSLVAPTLEMGEAVGAPVSYASIECGGSEQQSYRVYLASADNGESWVETGRCQLESGSFCNIGFPDGRIIGLDVPRINEDRTGWCDFIEVRESRDGGSTWTTIDRLLEGQAPYLWRVRRLADGTIIVLASLYGTAWGPGRPRATRNTMLPGETYVSKIQAFFLASTDGVHYTGPHYVLPGIGAHEFDVVELDDGALLFIAGDVQATPVGRQVVRRDGARFYNEALLPIHRGAPADPAADPQGGFVPESVVHTGGGILVGSRRNKPYSVSSDLGANWTPVEGLPPSLYQPYLMRLPDGRLANFGHVGSDSAFGEEDMRIGVDVFGVPEGVPAPLLLELERAMDAERTRYLNRYRARLHSAGAPRPGERVDFRFVRVWNPDGSASTTLLDDADIVLSAETDAMGTAEVAAEMFDGVPDIHCYYHVDAVHRPADGVEVRSASRTEPALTPRRRDAHPHPAYFAHGVLWLSPAFVAGHAGLLERLRSATSSDAALPAGLLEPAEAEELLGLGVLVDEGGRLAWLRSVHAPRPLDGVQVQGSGDWYV